MPDPKSAGSISKKKDKDKKRRRNAQEDGTSRESQQAVPPKKRHKKLPPQNDIQQPSLETQGTDDILHMLRDMDPSRVSDLLTAMSDRGPGSSTSPNLYTALHANEPPGPSPFSFVPPRHAEPAPAQPIAGSSTLVPTSSPTQTSSHVPFDSQSSLPSPSHHAYILAHKWMSPSRLGLLAKTQGLVYKKGKFSAIEEENIRQAIERYRRNRGKTATDIQDLIFPKDEKNKDNDFWAEITSSVPMRPIIAVYHHVRRANHPLKHQGKWTAEEDQALIDSVMEMGQQWEKISLRVGRMASDCRDRYRNHLVDRTTRTSGAWSTEEEEQLTKIVTEMTANQKDSNDEVFWTKVSKLMGGKRGRQQCRIKWTDSLSKTVKSGQEVRWGSYDAYMLVHKVAALGVRHETEIDWKTLCDAEWNLWSGHILQRRWQTMKKSINGYESMSHQELVEILKTKKTKVTPNPKPQKPKPKGKERVISAEMVSDTDEESIDVNIDPALTSRDV